jgi:hypothetical protein
MYSSSDRSWFRLQRRQARLGDDVVFEVQDPLEILQRHVEQQADARRQRLQEPDVRDRSGQLDMAHALAAHADSVTSTPHFSQMTPLYFMRLYLPHRHS